MIRHFLLLSCFAVLCGTAFGQVQSGEHSQLSAKELAQGYRDGIVLAKPRADHRSTVDADEVREGIRLRRKFQRFGDWRVIELPSAESVTAAMQRLHATGRYEYVEPAYMRHSCITPNDPHFNNQWALNNNGGQLFAWEYWSIGSESEGDLGTLGGILSGLVAGADISAPSAWNVLHDAPNVVVAVIDTGVRITHEDLEANLWVNPNPNQPFDDSGNGGLATCIDSLHGLNATVGNGPPEDDNGHGTWVSGILGAVGNNSKGICGVAWNVQIMALKANVEYTRVIDFVPEVTCIDYAIAHGANIINFSSVGPFSQLEFDAISRARAAGILFVAGAGDTPTDIDVQPNYPAAFSLDNIVAVAASDDTDSPSQNSYGSGLVELFAPGVHVLSTWNGSDSDYQWGSGTSASAPFVSGALALLKVQFPSDTPRQHINRLLRSVDKKPSFTGRVQTGGRLNLYNALTSTDNRPFNDDFETRAVLASSSPINVRSSNVGATRETNEPLIAGNAGGASLWWEWQAPATGTVTLNSSVSSFNTLLAVYTGTSLTALTPVASDQTNSLLFSAQAGTTYEISLDGVSGATGTVALTITDAAAAPPAIIIQPQNEAINSDQNAGFIVVASGTAPLSFHWYNGTNALSEGLQSDGSIISGSTNASLVISNTQPGDAGNYTVTITNVAGSVTSSNAILTVLPLNSSFQLPSWIEWYDTGINLLPGETVTINASGIIDVGALIAAYAYETPAGQPGVVPNDGATIAPNLAAWSLIGVIYSGTSVNPFEIGTGATFTALTGGELYLSVNDNWFYDNNGTWSINIIVSGINSLPIPTVTEQPQSQVAAVGSYVTFSIPTTDFQVMSNGALPFVYEWFENGVAIPNATNSTYSIFPTETNNAGIYSVVVSNMFGSVTSSNAELSVYTPYSNLITFDDLSSGTTSSLLKKSHRILNVMG